MGIHKSLEDVHATVDTTIAKNRWKRFFLFAGPAFLVAVGYMDPGNWASDIAAGSKYGYSLLWVLLMSNLIALLLQSLCARLGIVRGKDLAQASREAYPAYINISLWLLAEVAIAACDLAEVLGMAIGLKLLFGWSILWGITLAILDTFLVLYLQRKGMRYIEAFILSLVTLIGASFFIELFFARPQVGELVKGFVPNMPDYNEALYIAIAIIGATVMPHNLYLHSALVQTRRSGTDEKSLRNAIKYNTADSAIALNLAFFVNASILILAATVFFKNGYHSIEKIEDAHNMLQPLLGKKLAPILFAVALIASGQSSTITGTLAGQIVMEGYLDLRIAPWLRRLITRLLAVVPAFLVVWFMGEDKVDDMLLLSQVVLSLQLGFAVIPLISFVSDKTKMGTFAIKPVVQAAAWVSAAVIVGLNLKFIVEKLGDWQISLANHLWVYNFVLMPLIIIAGVLLLLVIFYSLWGGRLMPAAMPHGKAEAIPAITKKAYGHIAICIDFSGHDIKAITEGISRGDTGTHYYLIHVVETAGARTMGQNIHDFETREDWVQLQQYVTDLRGQGYQVMQTLGFGNPKKEIPRLTEKVGAELLVIARHGHRGLMDIVFGETINEVRHAVKCAVMIV